MVERRVGLAPTLSEWNPDVLAFLRLAPHKLFTR